MSKPTLTIAVPCPTCGGTKWKTISDNPTNGVFVQPGVIKGKCPNCTDGTIRQEVSCEGCLWAERQGDLGYLVCLHDESHGLGVMESFGCLNWEAKA